VVEVEAAMGSLEVVLVVFEIAMLLVAATLSASDV
jgi:hypothetical protein